MKKEGIRFHLPTPEMLTNEQRALISVDLSDPKRKGWGENLVVKGYGGTGKTVVAYYRALAWKDNRYKNYSGDGDRVLLLCFNKLLNNLLKSESSFPLSCDVYHLQKFYEDIRQTLLRKIREKGDVDFDGGLFKFKTFSKPYSNNEYYYLVYEKNGTKIEEKVGGSSRSPRYYANEQPFEFLKLLFSRYVEYSGKKVYKEIIIDEGQDLSENVLESLLILTDHISIFADDHQKLNESGISIEKMKAILIPKGEVEELTCNMRTTREIFEYAVETFLPDDEQANAMRTKKTCISIPESRPDENSWIEGDNETWANNTMDLIKKYSEQFSNILIVCPEKNEIKEVSTLLANNKILHGAYFNGIDFAPYLKENKEYLRIGSGNNTNLLVTTYRSAKGLEAECVIIYISEKEYSKFINGDIGDHNDNIFYTLATRPKKKLLFVTNFSLSKYL